MHMYLEHKSLAHIIKFSSNIYHCSATNLNLSQYILARQTICQQQHAKPCKECDALLFIANYILKNGFISLSKAFHEVFPSIKYSAEVAHRRFLQMPLMCIVVGDQKSGQSLSYLIEIIQISTIREYIDYLCHKKIQVILNIFQNLH